jgi:phosphoglycolate phosphatase
MPFLIAGATKTSVDGIVFDKDGTLIDQDGLMLAVGLERLRAMRELAGEEAAARWMERVGFDPAKGRADPFGPLAAAPKREEVIIAGEAIYQGGVPWNEARALAEQAYALADSRRAFPFGTAVLPGVTDFLAALRRAGVPLAIVTNDRRQHTREMLDGLGIGEHFRVTVTADDGLPSKPAPDAFLEACRRLGVQSNRTAMVGDTATDMKMGRAAGAALCVGVKTGMNRGIGLDGTADVILESVGDLRIV